MNSQKSDEFTKNLYFGLPNIDFSKSLGMACPGVENVGVPRASILELSRASQLPYNNTKYKKMPNKSNKWPRPPLTPIHTRGALHISLSPELCPEGLS